MPAVSVDKLKLKSTIVFHKNWNAIHARNADGERLYRYIINEGSSRSSKTISLIDCYDSYCRGYEHKRLTVWRDTKTDCKKTVLNDIIKHLRTTSRYCIGQQFNKTESIFSYNTGSTLEIHGTDDEETVHGLTQDAAWMNEPYKISRETFDQIDQRTSDFIFIDWNPKKDSWIEDLKKDPRTLVIHSTFRDNPFCPAEQRTKILSYQPVKRCKIVEEMMFDMDGEGNVVNRGNITNNKDNSNSPKNYNLNHEELARQYDTVNNPLNFTPSLLNELVRCRNNEDRKTANDFNWCVYGLGIKSEKPNRIFFWDEIPLEEYRRIHAEPVYGVDWGAVDPWGILEAKYMDGCLYLHELNYKSENEIRANLTGAELAQVNAADEGLVSWLFAHLGMRQEYAVICDNNRVLKIAAARRAGWYAMPAMKPKDSIIDGIDVLNGLRVYYTSSSLNLKYEQENYSRKVDRYGIVLEEPEDMDNHLCDPARYIAQYLKSIGVIRHI